MINRRTLLAGLASVAAASQSGRARAQAYPSRSITLLVPFAAAGGTDIAARRLGESLSQTLGQTIVIKNRPGANGIVAGQALPKADPDGYTLLWRLRPASRQRPRWARSCAMTSGRILRLSACSGCFRWC